jgi:mannitol/fructose-specific phosphotransferase system IIA component (Ntr-type)
MTMKSNSISDEDQYDHDLIVLLQIMSRIDLDQFTDDLLANNPKKFHELKETLIKKGRVDVYRYK